MSKNGINDPVDKCLFDINMAFIMSKPAIICSHRVNYAGFIVPANRDKTLRMLKKLLKSILNRWPDIEFMSSSKLLNIILSNSN